MARPAPAEPAPARFTAERYFALADEGILAPEDRVELLEGVVVSMSPRNPLHDTMVDVVDHVLSGAVGERATVRCQLTLVAGALSVPEPDVAVVPGRPRDYLSAHPRTALLVVEVADSSLPQDRVTKAAIYAAAGIPEYWIVNLRDGQLETFRDPDRSAGRYRETRTAARGDCLTLVGLPGVQVAVEDLLPDPVAIDA